MRILQLIDSLDPGGAEKMAVSFANAFAKKVEFSGLAATRREGDLKSLLSEKVSYVFLDRKVIIDIRALLKLRRFCTSNRVTHIQAHGSSFFLAVLLKLALPKVRIIWHDHYGLSDYLDDRKSTVLKLGSYFFYGVISVNEKLKCWAQRKLNCKNVIFLPNFISTDIEETPKTALKGSDGKRILCLANLRSQKNHFFLIEVSKSIKELHPDWTFHLVGKDFEDEYSKEVKSAIEKEGLSQTVFVYGSQNDVQHIILQADIAILTSQSEGLPVAFLEYGWSKKPVVVTAVGELPQIILNEENGFIVPKDDIDGFCNSLIRLIENESLRLKMGNALAKTIHENHSEEAVINKLIYWLGND